MFLLTALLFVQTAYAQPSNLPVPPSCLSVWQAAGNPGDGFTCISDYIKELTQIVVGFAASLSLVMVMVNGIRFMIGPAVPGGSSDAAKKGLTAALAGLAVSLLAYIILDTFIFNITQ
jgi:hypothetical protein